MPYADPIKQRDYMIQWALKNPDKVKKNLRKSSQKQRANPVGRGANLRQAASWRARTRGLAFDITKEWMSERLTEGRCALTGLPFDLAAGGPHAPSLDRIVPELGYVMSNCRVIIAAANFAKHQWSDDVLYDWAEALLAHRIHGSSDTETLH